MCKDLSMSNEEILRSYKGAADPKKQVGILADLNACPVEVIIEILKAGGVDGRTLPRPKKKRKSKNTAPAVSLTNSTDMAVENISKSSCVGYITSLKQQRSQLLQQISAIDAELAELMCLLCETTEVMQNNG